MDFAGHCWGSVTAPTPGFGFRWVFPYLFWSVDCSISAIWKRHSLIRSKMTTAISVKNLGKQYKIGAAQGKFRYGMLRDVFVDSLTAPLRYARSLVGRSGNRQLTNGKNF